MRFGAYHNHISLLRATTQRRDNLRVRADPDEVVAHSGCRCLTCSVAVVVRIGRRSLAFGILRSDAQTFDGSRSRAAFSSVTFDYIVRQSSVSQMEYDNS